jgi:NAD-reducing hydrogenase large subunit
MNRAVHWVAKNILEKKPEITEGMLNRVEIAIRAYDPCLSCATHALGTMPLEVELYDSRGRLLDCKKK